jgi:hypothetical protein
MGALLGAFVEKVAFFHRGALLNRLPSGLGTRILANMLPEKYCIIVAAAQGLAGARNPDGQGEEARVFYREGGEGERAEPGWAGASGASDPRPETEGGSESKT